jgi:hypothetical protein
MLVVEESPWDSTQVAPMFTYDLPPTSRISMPMMVMSEAFSGLRTMVPLIGASPSMLPYVPPCIVMLNWKLVIFENADAASESPPELDAGVASEAWVLSGALVARFPLDAGVELLLEQPPKATTTPRASAIAPPSLRIRVDEVISLPEDRPVTAGPCFTVAKVSKGRGHHPSRTFL